MAKIAGKRGIRAGKINEIAANCELRKQWRGRVGILTGMRAKRRGENKGSFDLRIYHFWSRTGVERRSRSNNFEKVAIFFLRKTRGADVILSRKLFFIGWKNHHINAFHRIFFSRRNQEIPEKQHRDLPRIETPQRCMRVEERVAATGSPSSGEVSLWNAGIG